MPLLFSLEEEMDKRQIEEIQVLRKNGKSMGQISKETGIPVSTVKSHFRRHGTFHDGMAKSSPGATCTQCGKALKSKGRGKPKRFCCEPCRRTWWKENTALSEAASKHQVTCATCGKSFGSFKSRNRKYCSHECFIKNRFGKEEGNDKGSDV